MENIKTTVGEVEEILYDRQDEINEEIQIYQIPVDGDETAQIETDGVRICIPELNVCARFGEYLRYDEDEEDYCADFSVTLIYDLDETNPEKYLYWEQDGLAVSLYNFCCQGKTPHSIAEISEMKCEVFFEGP